MHLALKDTVTGSETPVLPPFGTGAGWIATSVRCPSHPFTVIASDESTTSWFAFRQPAEIAWASVMAEWTIQQWRVLAIVAALLVVVAAVPAARRVPAATPERERLMPDGLRCRTTARACRARSAAAPTRVTLIDKMGYGSRAAVDCGLVYANPRAPHDTILARYSRDYFWNEYLPSLGVADGTLRSGARSTCGTRRLLRHDGGAGTRAGGCSRSAAVPGSS